MPKIITHQTPSLSITLGAKPMDLKVEGIFVRNGIEEINAFIETTGKKNINAFIDEKNASLEQAINLFNANAFEKTNAFNQHLEEQKNYLTEEAIKYATAPIEENPDGSAKYWAQQAKINYESALVLIDEINNEEV